MGKESWRRKCRLVDVAIGVEAEVVAEGLMRRKTTVVGGGAGGGPGVYS